MSIAHLLEDFGLSEDSGTNIRLITEDGLEDHRLAAFEKGYAAGWDDALAARTSDHAQLSETMSRNLEDLSFTYHEAAAQMVSGVEPVFRVLVNAVLPRILRDVAGELIVEKLCELAREQANAPACIAVAPGEAAALEPVLQRDYAMPVRVIEDDAISPGQARITVGAVEEDLDQDRLLTSIGEVVDGFFHQIETEEESRHG